MNSVRQATPTLWYSSVNQYPFFLSLYSIKNQLEMKTFTLRGQWITFAGVARAAVVVFFAFQLWGCVPGDKETVEPESDEFVSGRIDGKTIRGIDPVVFFSADYDATFGILGTMNINDNQGYMIRFSVDNPKVGTFTTQKDVTGSITYFAGTILSPTIREYELTKTAQNTVTITKLDPNGYAEGEFTLTGRASNGSTITITEGKFHVRLD